MHSFRDYNLDSGPRQPSHHQHSAWKVHSSVRKIIILLWLLIPTCAAWGGIVVGAAIGAHAMKNEQQVQSGVGSWSFLPNPQTTSSHLPLVVINFQLLAWNDMRHSSNLRGTHCRTALLRGHRQCCPRRGDVEKGIHRAYNHRVIHWRAPLASPVLFC